MRVVFCLALSFSLVGCALPHVRREAAVTLKCPEGKVELKERQKDTWAATGCGRMAICMLPAPDAEVQCSGGAELARP